MKTTQLVLASTLCAALLSPKAESQTSVVFDRALRFHGVEQTVTQSAPEVLGTGNGTADYLVADPFASSPTSGQGLAGVVRMFAGGSGALLWETEMPLPANIQNVAGARFGESIAMIPDTNGDMIADVIVGAPFAPILSGGATIFPGQAMVLDGATGSLLRTFTGAANNERFGQRVMSLRGNVFVLVPDGPNPRVLEFNPTNGALVFNHTIGLGAEDLIAVGDHDGAGAAVDFAVSFPNTLAPAVQVIDGTTGAQVGVLFNSGTFTAAGFGTEMAVLPGAGSMGPNGPTDLLVVSDPNFNNGAGSIWAIDGPFASVTPLLQGSSNEGVGLDYSIGGDIDGDGLADLVSLRAGGLVDIFNIDTSTTPPLGAILPAANVNTISIPFQTPDRVDVVGDLNGDGFVEMAFREALTLPAPFAQVTMVFGGPVASINQAFAPGCGVNVPVVALTQVTPMTIGGGFSFTATPVDQFSLVSLQVGFPSATPISIGPSICTTMLAGAEALDLMINTTPPAQTYTSPVFPVPSDPTLLGVNLAFQTVQLPVGGGLAQLSTSNAISSIVGW